MVLQGNCKILLFFCIIALVVPASADTLNVTFYPLVTSTPEPPVPFTITLFIPTSTMIHSNQITDMVRGPDGEVVIATSFGLSTYNGSWSTRHMTHDNLSEGLMDDYITAVEYDRNGSLWIGYAEGIQIYNGNYYQTFRDQQLLKNMEIKDLQRWNNDMWIATGHAGVHRYRDGEWTWFQPESPGGPGFYEIDSMVIDPPPANMSLIATEGEGLWIIRSQDDPIHFECIAAKGSTYGLLDHVRLDPNGGAYFFNASMVVHYSPDVNFTPVLNNRNLAITVPSINDLAAGPDALYLATDTGIYIWKNGGIFRRLDRFEGIGTSSVVRTINIDTDNRVWFSTQDDVGYYVDRVGEHDSLVIETVTSPTPTPAPATTAYVRPIPTLREDAPVTSNTSDSGGIDSIISPIILGIKNLLSGFGISI
ncbi:MAG: hypothetical protein M0R30_13945 [Methanoregula sp.]|jgi:ligand-binding sensor domain-containing protein|uniref:two-component regulator propeller domain-containing protein n=1 Tax=Methanoregula sp. TaxID=2052170 RepID=UPI0025DBBD79|nr:two-component regulator propeller domain-containing protein [Methanoregula sp.]MCK9632729.1 hypothetical protein [Methanoregula sp.]